MYWCLALYLALKSIVFLFIINIILFIIFLKTKTMKKLMYIVTLFLSINIVAAEDVVKAPYDMPWVFQWATDEAIRYWTSYYDSSSNTYHYKNKIEIKDMDWLLINSAELLTNSVLPNEVKNIFYDNWSNGVVSNIVLMYWRMSDSSWDVVWIGFQNLINKTNSIISNNIADFWLSTQGGSCYLYLKIAVFDWKLLIHWGKDQRGFWWYQECTHQNNSSVMEFNYDTWTFTQHNWPVTPNNMLSLSSINWNLLQIIWNNQILFTKPNDVNIYKYVCNEFWNCTDNVFLNTWFINTATIKTFKHYFKTANNGVNFGGLSIVATDIDWIEHLTSFEYEVTNNVISWVKPATNEWYLQMFSNWNIYTLKQEELDTLWLTYSNWNLTPLIHIVDDLSWEIGFRYIRDRVLYDLWNFINGGLFSWVGSGTSGWGGGWGGGGVGWSWSITYDSDIFKCDQDWDWECGILNWEIFVAIWKFFQYIWDWLLTFFSNVKDFIKKIGWAYTEEVKTFSFDFSLIKTSNADYLSNIYNNQNNEANFKETSLGKITIFIKAFVIFVLFVVWIMIFILLNKKRND